MDIISKKQLSCLFVLSLAITLFVPITKVNSVLDTPILSTYDVKPGDEFQIVDGAGSTAGGDAIQIFWDIASGSNAFRLYPHSGLLSVPQTTAGIHYLWVSVPATGETIKSDGITVSPNLIVNPSSGNIGDIVNITGYGFEDEQGVNVNFYNDTGNTFNDIITSYSSVETNEKGTFSVEYQIPNLDFGIYYVNASDSTNDYTRPFEVPSQLLNLTLSASESINIGSLTEISGEIFCVNGSSIGEIPVLVRSKPLYGSQWTEVSSFLTDMNGSFTFQWIPTASGAIILKFDLHEPSNLWVDESETYVEVIVETISNPAYQMNLSIGWNMISSLDMEINASTVFPDFYQLVTWDGSGYISATVMEPGKGYWALVLEETQIQLPPT